MARDSPKVASRWPIWAQRGLNKDVPRWPQDGQIWLQDGSNDPLPSWFFFLEVLFYFLLFWKLIRFAKSLLFLGCFNVLGPCWALFWGQETAATNPFPIGVGPPTL
jgi:hypothetical protein